MSSTAVKLSMTELAQRYNDHLQAGGIVQVATSMRATNYDKRHAGWFSEKNGALFVRHGRTTVKLGTNAIGLLVSIRTGRLV